MNNIEEQEDESEETRCDMAKAVIKIIKKANEEDQISILHEMFPPVHDLLIDELESKGQALTSIVIANDNKLFFKTGDEREWNIVYNR